MRAPDLGGKVVVVTGAGGRLGRVLVRQLLEVGARVAGLDLVPASDLPEGALALGADLGSEDEVVDAFARIGRSLGPADALVHTVGMWAGKPLARTSFDDWETMLHVNLTSAFLCFREAARAMQGRGGRLVGIASRQGADRGAAEQAAYSASKAGVMRLVEAVAAEYDGTRITAAAVAPSTILFGGEGDDAKGVSVEDVAALCVYLCGPGGAVHNGAVLRAYGTAL
ncbi:MAG TPA: SDR family NAD(P)-dependent oxidoreductase [Rubricoccaceae bacterium]|nr:SDR family NAD(P)-dependent oxidoreductase [Rubricoccaceae bacterium]